MNKENASTKPPPAESEEQKRLRQKLEDFRRKKEEERTRGKRPNIKTGLGNPSTKATTERPTLKSLAPSNSAAAQPPKQLDVPKPKPSGNKLTSKRSQSQLAPSQKQTSVKSKVVGPRQQLSQSRAVIDAPTAKPDEQQTSYRFLSADNLISMQESAWFAKAAAQIGTPLPNVVKRTTHDPHAQFVTTQYTPGHNGSATEVEHLVDSVGRINLQEGRQTSNHEAVWVPETPAPKPLDAAVQTTPSLLKSLVEQFQKEALGSAPPPRETKKAHDIAAPASDLSQKLEEDRLFYAALTRDDPFHFYLCQPIVLRILDSRTGEAIRESQTPVVPFELLTWKSAETLAQANEVASARVAFQILANDISTKEAPRVMFPVGERRRIVRNHAWQNPLFWINWSCHEERWGAVDAAFEVLAKGVSILVSKEAQDRLFGRVTLLDQRYPHTLWEHASEPFEANGPSSVEAFVDAMSISLEDDSDFEPDVEENRSSPIPPRTWYEKEDHDSPKLSVPALSFVDTYKREYPSPPRLSAAHQPFQVTEPLQYQPQTAHQQLGLHLPLYPSLTENVSMTPNVTRNPQTYVEGLVGMLGSMSVDSRSARQNEQESKHAVNRELEWTMKDKVKTEKNISKPLNGVRIGSQTDGSTITILTPVRAKKKDREALGGQSVVLTPVRRSVRHFHETAKDAAQSDQDVRLESVLANHDFAYAPNPALPVDVGTTKAARRKSVRLFGAVGSVKAEGGEEDG